jgi:hypothetical protein
MCTLILAPGKPVPRQNSVRLCFQQHTGLSFTGDLRLHDAMLRIIRLFLASIVCIFHSRRTLWVENLALRQQLSVLKRKHPRPLLTAIDKLFWVIVRRLWPKWKQALIVVSPETVVRWHRAGFGLYWSWFSRRRICLGRKRASKELRELIFKMVVENPTWGAPRIHGELQLLGFDVSERTVSRWRDQHDRESKGAFTLQESESRTANRTNEGPKSDVLASRGAAGNTVRTSRVLAG